MEGRRSPAGFAVFLVQGETIVNDVTEQVHPSGLARVALLSALTGH